MKLLQKTPKCVLKSFFEVMKVLLVLCFLDLENEIFSQRHNNLDQFSILSAFSKILKIPI